MPLAERLAAALDYRGETECWLWCGGLRDGYGRVKVAGQTCIAHIVVYELLVGAVPDGLELDHLCRVRRCCNPGHLETVTHLENVLRGESWAAIRARQTHCKRGHLLAGANVYVPPSEPNSRLCRSCRSDRDRRVSTI